MGDGFERRRRTKLPLVVGKKQRDAEEGVVEFVERLALRRLREDFAVELGNEQRSAGLKVISNVIEDARFGVSLFDRDAARSCLGGGKRA